MAYKVIAFFTDLQDNNHAYKAGDTFPRDGVEVSEERLKELSTANNRRGKPLIRKKVEKAPTAEAKKTTTTKRKKKNVE